MERTYKLSEHFTLAEMMRSSTAERVGIDNMPPTIVIHSLVRVCKTILEPVREHFGKPFRPNSGFRSMELNLAVGGSKNSQHCDGNAVDFEVAGVSNYDLAVWVRDNIDFDQLILECYREGEPTSGWVHVSTIGVDNQFLSSTYTNRKYLNGLVR